MREPMNDIRNRLLSCVSLAGPKGDLRTVQDRVDCILARFEVTPKPAVTERELGEMVITAWSSSEQARHMGQSLLTQLAAAGLRIVRVDEP